MSNKSSVGFSLKPQVSAARWQAEIHVDSEAGKLLEMTESRVV